MGKIGMPGGGGGADTSIVTATAGDVLSGKVIVDKDGNPLTGSLALSGNASAANVLSGKTFYNTDAKTKQTGTMADQGAKTSSLNCGGSYTIPAGYHNGSGKITANSLASQTDATATAAYIRSGYTAWVKGSKLTGSMAVTSAINFKATAQSASVIRISWTNPSTGPWEGVEIRMSTSGNPGVSGGTQKYKGRGNNATAGGSNYVDITGLSFATTYYFTCTSYATGLGNGSSYNVNAKTTDYVLWDGSSFPNGGRFYDEDRCNPEHDIAQGLTSGRKLVVKLKKTHSSATYIVSLKSATSSNSQMYRYDNKGNASLYSSEVSRCSWTANTEYLLDLSINKYASSAGHISHGLVDKDGMISTEEWLAYVAIR